jgi:hypothetical protein
MPAQPPGRRPHCHCRLSEAASGPYLFRAVPVFENRAVARSLLYFAYPAIMASNLDYLNPALIPLEEKVNAYLEAEKSLRRAETDATQTSDVSRGDLARMEQEIIALLPTRDEWVKVNLGYGPSRVGAWLVPAFNGAPERYELRVVH